MKYQETILSISPGATDQQRLVVVLRSIDGESSPSSPALQLHDPNALATDLSATNSPTSSPQNSTPNSQPRPAKASKSATTTAFSEGLFCERLTAVQQRPIALRQESFSPAVGWFTQSELEMSEAQWQAMRCTVIPTSALTPSSAHIPSSAQLPAQRTPRQQQVDQVSRDDSSAMVIPFSPDQAASA
ncbi:hypothetical protein SAMN06265222_11797 [Neorhodopirellula lusitana]|uniref:Uncharacterized protein n=1 Tax=Neorhodopirellula lusitana TaxID=445327 RepID=A0ABY1QLF0_9BACT|nr:hypothetical protein [Neorhodopirellula lusitana]SMP74287.1 hypothetical protein SAMN06265222_11797 [Neorhodopirellula lusitana]